MKGTQIWMPAAAVMIAVGCRRSRQPFLEPEPAPMYRATVPPAARDTSPYRYQVNGDYAFDAWRFGDTVEVLIRSAEYLLRTDAGDRHVRRATLRPTIFRGHPRGWTTRAEGDARLIEPWIRAGSVTLGDTVVLRVVLPRETNYGAEWLGFRIYHLESNPPDTGYSYAHSLPRVYIRDLPTTRFRRPRR